MRRLLYVLALGAALAASAEGATITTRLSNDGSNAHEHVIVVSGEIVKGDNETFTQVADTIPRSAHVVVNLDGPGGNFITGMGIAATVFLNHFDTIVHSDQECSSICAVVWLAGDTRWITKTAKIGFHAAYAMNDDGKPEERGDGNALVGAFYSSELHLGMEAIIWLTHCKPTEMCWLTADKAKELGIAAKEYDDHPAEAKKPPPSEQGLRQVALTCAPKNDVTDTINVTAQFDTADKWSIKSLSVVHKIGGQSYVRSDQYGSYTLSHTDGKYDWWWSGTRFTNARETMLGHLYFNNNEGGWHYNEVHRMDMAQDFAMEALCR